MRHATRLSLVLASLLLLAATSPAAASSCYNSATGEPQTIASFSGNETGNGTVAGAKVCAIQNFLLTAEGSSQLLPFTPDKAAQFKQAVLASLNLAPSYAADNVDVQEAPQTCMKGRVILQVQLRRPRGVSSSRVKHALARMDLFFPGNGAHFVQDWFKGRLCKADSSGCIGPYVSALNPLADCGVQACLALDGSEQILSSPAAWTAQAAISSSLVASMGPQNKNCSMAVMQFPKVTTVMVPPTTKKVLSPQQLSAMILKVGPSGGRLTPSRGIEACTAGLKAMDSTQPRRLLLLLYAPPGRADRLRLNWATKAAKAAGIEVLMVGGPSVPLKMMKALASSPNNAYQLRSATDAASVLEVATAAAQGLCGAGTPSA